MKVERPWGWHRILHNEDNDFKCKELTIEPHKSMSLQRHDKRSEFYFITHGKVTLYGLNRKSDVEQQGIFGHHQHIFISQNQWHQLVNETDDVVRLIEIQYGDDCTDEDIIRR